VIGTIPSDRGGVGVGAGPALGVAVVALAAIGAGQAYRSIDGPGAATSVWVRNPRVVVLLSKHRAHLFDGDRLIRTYPVDVGVASGGQILRAGDGRTPTGRFHIVSKNPDSPHHRFLGIDFPNGEAVAFGLRSGLISLGEASSILDHQSPAGGPRWGTALGGGLGIHGRRVGRDWTGGCVALSDRDVEELYDVLRIGDPVEILP
jgi:lipoprotein-anchoring transpeptidase ErfK/SrfK